MTHYTFDDWQARARSLTLRGQAYIDGAYTDAADGATFVATSPIDGRKLCLLYTSDAADE